MGGALLLAVLVTVPVGADEYFRRGDSNASGAVRVSDAVDVLRALFLDTPAAIACRDAADADDDGAITIGDALRILSFVFVGGTPPAAPFPECGKEESEHDALGCDSFPPCTATRAVVLCCDRSASTNGSEFRRIKTEAMTRIQQFDDRTEFGMIFFDTQVIRYPPSGLVRGSTSYRQAAMALVMSLQTGPGTCTKTALLAALDLALMSSAAERRIMLISDGRNLCQGQVEETYSQAVLDAVAEKNAGGSVIIDTGCMSPADGANEAWLQDLAARNGGTYTRIE